MMILAACAGAPPADDAAARKAAQGPGLSLASAVEVCGPRGARAFLLRLRCADGARPQLGPRETAGLRDPRQPMPIAKARAATEGDQGSDASAPGPDAADLFRRSLDPDRALRPGEPDPHVVDAFAVGCGAAQVRLFVDQYHCAQAAPVRAPPGLTLAPE